MVIRTNTSALRTYNAGRKTTRALSKNLEKLSSGYRVNRAADDAAGLGVSERIHAKMTELGRCEHNATEGIDLARTADAALQEVNDMLKRARSLCIQAENGTYSDQELAAISGEMNHLFGEIDRISAGSYHNTICLFRQGVGHTYHEEYDEKFTPLGDDFQLWGEMDFIVGKDFEEAADATPATATFELDDSVDPTDPRTMEGKALNLGGTVYYFTSGNKTPLVSSYAYATKVAIGATMGATLANLVSASSKITGASIDGRTVTLTGALANKDYTLPPEIDRLPHNAPKWDAEWIHGTTVSSPTELGTLGAVDGTDASDNKVVYETPVTLTYDMKKKGTGAISTADLEHLKKNSITLERYEDGYPKTSKTFAFSGWGLGTTIKTWDEFGQKLATEIKGQSGYTAAYAGGKVTVTYNNAPTDKPTKLYLSVGTGKISDGTQDKTLKTWTSKSVTGFKITQDRKGAAEALEQCTVEIPAMNNIPCSFSVGSHTHLYYNANDPEMKAETAKEGVTLNFPDSYYDDRKHNVSSIDQAAVAKNILSDVRTAMNGIADVKIVGNKLVVTATKLGSPDAVKDKLNTIFRGVTRRITAVKKGTPATYSDPIINGNTASSPSQKSTVTFELGSDLSQLEGKGFSLENYYKFEFINSDNDGSRRSDYSDIDLKTANTHEKVRSAVANKLHLYGYTVALEGTKLKISRSGKFAVTDGILGMDPLSKGGVVQFSGGVNGGQSQTSIDFSSINEDNLDTLLGKGFRINCATCSGEYINVFFCWTNDGSVPTSFDRWVDDGTGTGALVKRTIHNIPVELSKITDGDRIVEDIVRQVRPNLKHYTDVMVGDPPTTLIAMERRWGDVIYDGELKLGRVESGVETNFTYSVSHKWVEDPIEGDLEELQTATVNIYVGSDPEAQIIPIHLPYIDLQHLRLRPPEQVDLTSPDQDPADWLGRIDRADLAISSARGTIGADYNRLEHAIQDLSNANIQLSDAYSVIRDADMAELMKEQTKLQILVQAQQSMQAQANQTPQGALELLR